MKCPRYYLLNQIRGIQPIASNVHLAYGSAIDAGVSFLYQHRGDYSFSELKRQAIQEFAIEWTKHGLRGNEKKNLATGMVIMDAYCTYYKNDTAKYHPDYIQAPVHSEMADGSLLGGVIDRVWQMEDNVVCPVDTKTSGWPLTPYWWKQWQNSFQMTAYYYLCEQILGHIVNIQIDAIKVPMGKTMEDTFQRRIFDRTPLQIKEFKRTYTAKVAKAKRAAAYEEGGDTKKAEQEMHCEQAACSDYGGCKYLDICMHGMNHPTAKLNFETITRPKEIDDGEDTNA